MRITLYLTVSMFLFLALSGSSRHTQEEPDIAKAMANKEQIIELLRSTGRPGIEVVISYLDTTDFYTIGGARHHTGYGGIAQHSLEVYRIMRLVAWFQPYDSIVITALLHDMGKIEVEGWHPFRSVKILTELGFQLTDDERITILRHHRQELHYFRLPLRRALTFADMLSAGWWKLWHLRATQNDCQ